MVNINGTEWRIYLATPFHPEMQRSDGSFAIGSCNNSTKKIYINDQLDPELMKRVLAHELTHAAMFSYGINLNYYQEELLADLVATYGQEIVCNTNILFRRLKEKRETRCF